MYGRPCLLRSSGQASRLHTLIVTWKRFGFPMHRSSCWHAPPRSTGGEKGQPLGWLSVSQRLEGRGSRRRKRSRALRRGRDRSGRHRMASCLALAIPPTPAPFGPGAVTARASGGNQTASSQTIEPVNTVGGRHRSPLPRSFPSGEAGCTSETARPLGRERGGGGPTVRLLLSLHTHTLSLCLSELTAGCPSRPVSLVARASGQTGRSQSPARSW